MLHSHDTRFTLQSTENLHSIARRLLNESEYLQISDMQANFEPVYTACYVGLKQFFLDLSNTVKKI